MEQPAHLRISKNKIAQYTRHHGPDAPLVHAARRQYAVELAAHSLAGVRAQHGPFTNDQRQLILDALGGDAR